MKLPSIPEKIIDKAFSKAYGKKGTEFAENLYDLIINTSLQHNVIITSEEESALLAKLYLVVYSENGANNIRNRIKMKKILLNGDMKNEKEQPKQAPKTPSPLPECWLEKEFEDATNPIRFLHDVTQKELEKRGIPPINRNIVKAYLSEMIGLGFDMTKPDEYIPELIGLFRKRGILNEDSGLTSLPPFPTIDEYELPIGMFEKIHKKTNTKERTIMIFIQDFSKALADSGMTINNKTQEKTSDCIKEILFAIVTNKGLSRKDILEIIKSPELCKEKLYSALQNKIV